MNAPTVLCAALEVALNRYLGLEPDVLAECARLKGRVIALRAIGPEWEFFLVPHAGGVQVLDRWEGKADVRIAAPPTRLLTQAVLNAGQGTPPLSGVQVEGDAELLSRFGSLLARVGFDPEEWLARSVGDAAAHRIAEGLSALFGWGRRSASTLALDTAEYLREETRDLVHRDDVERWMDEVDRVRERTDRLAAKLDRLERVLPPLQKGAGP